MEKFDTGLSYIFSHNSRLIAIHPASIDFKRNLIFNYTYLIVLILFLSSDMRLLIGYFLSICFLLLGSYAHADEISLDQPCQQTTENPVLTTLSSLQHYDILVCSMPSGKESITDRSKATEIEEDSDSESFRKLLETGICRITSFYALQPGCIVPILFSSHRPNFSHFSATAADKFIVNCVFRI